MTFENRKRLAKHFYKQGEKKHPYYVEMKKKNWDNPDTEEIEDQGDFIEDEETEIITTKESEEVVEDGA